MAIRLKQKVMFPKDFPDVTAGIIILEENALITGHKNGVVVRWSLNNSDYKELFDSDSAVQSISYSGNRKIAIGYHSGGLFILGLDDESVVTLREPTYSKSHRIWKTLWYSNQNLLITSTYGEITSFVYNPDKGWEEEFFSLKGHEDSVFGLGSINSKYIATGDYRGNVIIWKFEDNEYKDVQKLSVVGNVQDLCWYTEQCFAVITSGGQVSFIEKIDDESEKWQIAVQVDVARSRGICITITDDGKTIFAGTLNEIIQFDIDTNQIGTIFSPVRRIFSVGSDIYVLNDKGLHTFEARPVEIPKEIIDYRFVKISLLGRTGTGKSTFCTQMMKKDIDNIKSTYGKKIFNWSLSDEKENRKRIIFHDHGGQETVLDTFIPFLKDSNIILLFYKQTDSTTFDRALDILDELQDVISENIDVYLVQTFIDHGVDAIPYKKVNSLLENGEIKDFIKISPLTKEGFDLFENKILNNLDWNKARVMIQSPLIDGISQAFSVLQEEGYQVVNFEVFKDIYQKVVGETVTQSHLKFLLEDYTNQGVIEFYPDISDTIIFNDEEFNKMRTEVPIYVDQMKGVVNVNNLGKKFDNQVFLRILDEMYTQSGFAIKNEELRIFPSYLPEEPCDIPESYVSTLSDEEQIDRFVDYKRLEVGPLIDLLSEIKLQCIEVTKHEGLFSWEKNAFIYYLIQEERRGVLKRYIKFTFIVGGNKPSDKERLKKEFSMIIDRLYGPIIDMTIEDKKKDEEKIELNDVLKKIQEYEKLINEDAEEPQFQKFFEENPFFLDPKVKNCFPKKSFGGEAYPDFVLILQDSSYIIVEIEKPGVKLFTIRGDPTHELTHAQQQIREYWKWAIKQQQFLVTRDLPNISADNTKGLVVIGKKSSLASNEFSKLENINAEVRSRYIIKTFDELLEEAKIVIDNLRKGNIET